MHRVPSTLPWRRASLALVVATVAPWAAVSAAGDAGTTTPAESAETTADDQAAASGSVEGPGFATPEEAAQAYLAAMAEGDLSAALQAFAVETLVENYDLTAATERLGAFMPLNGTPALPNSNDLNIAFNERIIADQVAGQILLQYFTLARPDFDAIMATMVKPEEAAAFVAVLETDFDPALYAGAAEATVVELGAVDSAAAELYASENAAANRERLLGALGADELAAVALSFPANDPATEGDVTMVFEAVRYGDQWWLLRLGGEFAMLMNIQIDRSGVVEG